MTQSVAARGAGAKSKHDFPTGYFQKSETPLTSLIFLLPFMALFEIGGYFHPADPIAFQKLRSLFQYVGIDGRLFPGVVLAVVLLGWHVAKKDRWHVEWETIACMALECALLAIPLLTLDIALARWGVRIPLAAAARPWEDNTVLSLGAGIYEELVFRLILMTLMVLIFADALRMPRGWTNLLMVLASAILFSLYHYLGDEAFQLRSFVFRTLAGIYFAGLFITRGFGITAGCHVFYDVMLEGMKAAAHH